MYPAKFDYYRAGSVDEAISLLQQHGDDARVIAGGHSLLPMMKMRLAEPAVLVDIGRIDELRGIFIDRGAGATIGAMTPYVEIANHSDIQRDFGALADACAIIGDVQVRNRGTIGGNLAHNDPASDLPAVALALDATINVAGPNGTRSIPAEEFIVGLMATSLNPGEIVTSVHFPGDPGGDTRSAYAKFENPASGYAICGVAARVGAAGTRIAANGALDHARRLRGAESAFNGASGRDEAIAAAVAHATDGLDQADFMSDIHADAAYRAGLLGTLTRRALERALARR